MRLSNASTAALLVAFVVAASAVLPAAVAGQDRTGVTVIDSCTTITDPGRYELAADVGLSGTDDPRDACIEIRTGNVTLLGHGHVVGPGTSQPHADSVAVGTGTSTSLSNVTVRNVVVTAAVMFSGTPGATVRNVTARETSIYLRQSDGSLLVDNTVTGTVNQGGTIHVSESDGSVLANNTVRNPTDYHRRAIFVGLADAVVVRDNRLSGGGVGVELYGVTNGTVADNRIRASDQSAILLERGTRDTRFEDNVLSGRRGVTVRDGRANVFQNTTVQNASVWAFYLAGEGANRVETLRLGSATVSFRGQGVAVGEVDRPPAVPAGLASGGRYVRVVGVESEARTFFNLSYDETALPPGVDESDLRLYRRGSVYAPLAPTNGTNTTDTGGANGAGADDAEAWRPVPGVNCVNTSANYVYANATTVYEEPYLRVLGSENGTVRLSVRLPVGGWVGLFAQGVDLGIPGYDDLPDEYVELAHSGYIPPGEATTVTLTLPDDYEGSVPALALAIADVNENRRYEFDFHFPGPDYPYLSAETQVSFENGDGGGGDSEKDADGDGDGDGGAEMAPLRFEDQPVENGTVTVSRVSLPRTDS